ncbi:MAG: glycosyltransferase, partial [Solibacillus sp.]
FATKDKRIICIHQKNHGLSATRNIGYRASTGKFITFLDGDDWIEEKTCEDNYNLAEKNSSDIVIFGTIVIFERIFQKVTKVSFGNVI